MGQNEMNALFKEAYKDYDWDRLFSDSVKNLLMGTIFEDDIE